MDNISQQADELEVLNSIFDDQWKFNITTNSYSIQLAKDIELWITLNSEYPSDKPPTYELWAPNLSKAQKELVDNEFKEIYELEKGCPIIYQWIEKLKEIAFENTLDPSESNDSIKDLSDDIQSVLKVVETNRRESSIKLDIIHGTTILDRKSTFQGHVCKVTKPEHVRQFLDILYENKKIAQATHNILAYRILTEKNTLLQDCDDDGETHAGGRLLHLLDILDIKNVAVVVSRWYGGIHLGPDRFKHINNAGRQVLLEAGFIKS